MSKNSKLQHSTGQYYPAQREQWRIYLVALLVTFLLHAIFFVWAPERLFMERSDDSAVQDDSVELTLEPMDPEELSYVEANPEAPENEPDQKDRYSFKAQQAADKTAGVSQDNKPTVDGDEASQKIVQGSVEQQEPVLLEGGVFTLSGESVADQEESTETTQAPRVVPPAPDFVRQQPEVEDGPGSSLQISGAGKQVSEEYSDTDQLIQLYRAEPENPQDQKASESNSRTMKAKPLPRKRLTLPPDLVYGPLMRSEGSASRRGALAIDSTFSQFGEYEQQFYAAVQAVWYQEIDFFQPIDTSARVVVQFRIQSDGTVDEVKILHSTAGEVGTWICQLALTKRSPFRKWTEEMVQVFGSDRVMKVAFSYL